MIVVVSALQPCLGGKADGKFCFCHALRFYLELVATLVLQYNLNEHSSY